MKKLTREQYDKEMVDLQIELQDYCRKRIKRFNESIELIPDNKDIDYSTKKEE